jgi:hypothetical protein
LLATYFFSIFILSAVIYLFQIKKMPIGVPKVPFRLPGEEDAVWIDV